MNDTRKCPDLNLLKKFAVGAVDVHKLHSIGEHLDECETCQNAIESIHSNEDRLLLALQRSVAVETLQTADTSIAPSAKPSQQTTELEIPSTFGRYTIHKVLGQGAMGAVYLARDTQLDRDVALKIPKFAVGNGVDDAELLERFYREARASATLRSPNICPVHDVGEIDGQHYITMSFIDGRPLKDFTKSKQKHSERQIVKTIRKLALGLEQAHQIGVIHRDLKPANIMVDLQGEPVVMDFGLARRSESDDVQVTHSGVILGTPAYMSPEQVDGDQSAIGPQTDIYALGVIMYELITGELPFNGALMTLLAQISANNPTPPSALRDGLDPRLENICLKMMAGDLKQRYQSMSDVAVDLQSVLRQPNRNQKKEDASESGLRPSSVPTSDEDSHPALVSVAEPISFTKCSQTSPHEPKRNKKKFLFAGGLLGGVLILGIVIFVRVEMYEVQITVDDPSIVLSIDNKVIEMDSSDNVIKLSPGEHQLKLQKDELKPHVDNFTVARGGKTSLRAVVVEGRLDGLVNGEQPTVISKKTDTTELLELSPTNPQPGEFALRFTEGD